MTHQPIEREPRRLRPPYDKKDPWTEQNLWSTPPESTDAWRDRNRANDMEALTEVLGFTPTDYEMQQLQWLTNGELGTIAVIASLLARNRAHGKREGEIQALRIEAETLDVHAECDAGSLAAAALRSEAARMRRGADLLGATGTEVTR